MKITIDQMPVEVEAGTTVMQAATSVGIRIPALCYLKGFGNHPSCMVCIVQDLDSGRFIPSCAFPVIEGMNILTHSVEIREVRREALELLLSDHVGDCEAPCRLSCPDFMNIPLMNRLIAGGRFREALSVVREEIALPLILGSICPAPCEKACRRKPVDGAVSICQLKRFTAQEVSGRDSDLLHGVKKNGKVVAVIGTGPAGLSAAFHLLRLGHGCVLFEKSEIAGGTLRYEIPAERLPGELLDSEIDNIRRMGAEIRLNTLVDEEMFENKIRREFDAVILATGSKTINPIHYFGLGSGESGDLINKKTFVTSRPGVFGCGSMIREEKIAVRSSAQGKTAAIEVDIFLKTHKPGRIHYKFHSAISHLFQSEYAEYLKEGIVSRRTEPSAGIVKGFSDEEAMNEAKRCMHCDCRKPVTCKLRIYADQYHANRKRYMGIERRNLMKNIQHGFVVYEPEKCIKCGLCVEISKKEGENLGLTYMGRGFDVRIGVPFRENMSSALAVTATRCVEACPTGALAFKT